MATVASLIRSAFRTLGVIASGEAPTSADEQDALGTLNDMLDSWAGEKLVLYASQRNAYVLTPGLSPHTIGTSGTFSATRPVAVDRVSLLSSGIERPLDILTEAEWQATGNKTTSGTPTSLFVEKSYPLTKLWLNPVPLAADTLILYSRLPLGRFAATSSDFDLPPGYARAIRYCLAKELAPEYGVSLSPEALDSANESKATLKRLNTQDSVLRADPALMAGAMNLVTGDRK